MIRGRVVGQNETIVKLGKANLRVREAVRLSISRLTLELLRKVKADKLSGQVLNVRTGRLRRSITQRVETSPGQITGIVGTNVKYARVHEFGFTGPQSVKAHVRQIKSAFGRSLSGTRPVIVRAHSRNVHIPERSFLRSALADMEPRIRSQMRELIARELGGRL